MKSKGDVIVLGFRGLEILPIVRLLTRKKIFFDAFISVYDTLVDDRKVVEKNTLLAKSVLFFEKKVLSLADYIFLDTDAHSDYFRIRYQIDQKKLFSIPVGADENFFFQRECKRAKTTQFTVFYYGTALPLHGIDIILKAAKLLEKNKYISFTLVGPIRNTFKTLLEELQINNIHFIDWLSYRELSEQMNCADVCLGGHFSSIPKAARVISGKAYQMIALGKPTIVGKTKSNQAFFTDNSDCVFCEVNSPIALANSIEMLYNNEALRKKIGQAARELFVRKASTRYISNLLGDKIISAI
jgi:glycosyltransferase involved in cell wall biosynthesis